MKILSYIVQKTFQIICFVFVIFISGQTKTNNDIIILNYNSVQTMKNSNLKSISQRDTKIIIDEVKMTISFIDSEFPTPYILKLDKKCSKYNENSKIFCYARDSRKVLYLFMKESKKLEVLDFAGNGQVYVNFGK